MFPFAKEILSSWTVSYTPSVAVSSAKTNAENSGLIRSSQETPLVAASSYSADRIDSIRIRSARTLRFTCSSVAVLMKRVTPSDRSAHFCPLKL